jgi:predicted MFS family arabinose efflux permease
MNYGVFQEYYTNSWPLHGSHSATGIIGTTSNGVIYLTMPILFAAFSQRWARFRHSVALAGIALSGLGFLLSSFSNYATQLIATQGVLAALGSSLLYSPTTLALGESFTANNRAVAYGIVLSSKNIVGSTCPFILRALLDQYGFRATMRIWAAIVTGSSLCALLFMPMHPAASSGSQTRRRPRRTAWDFLRHRTIYIYSVATLMQSSGYGIPPTYLNSYAHDAASLSQASATLLLTLLNIPGIFSCSFFGYLTDNKRYPLSATTVTFISSIASALAVFCLWGLSSGNSMPLLSLFAITFGFFASGYSATWGGVIKQMEYEAADRNEAVDTGVVYGLLNGARGIGYVAGGLAGLPLLKAGGTTSLGRAGYGTEYGPLIVFTGLALAFGGWSAMWKRKGFVRCF